MPSTVVCHCSIAMKSLLVTGVAAAAVVDTVPSLLLVIIVPPWFAALGTPLATRLPGGTYKNLD